MDDEGNSIICNWIKHCGSELRRLKINGITFSKSQCTYLKSAVAARSAQLEELDILTNNKFDNPETMQKFVWDVFEQNRQHSSWAQYKQRVAQRRKIKSSQICNLQMAVFRRMVNNASRSVPASLVLAPLKKENISQLALCDLEEYLPDLLKLAKQGDLPTTLRSLQFDFSFNWESG